MIKITEWSEPFFFLRKTSTSQNQRTRSSAYADVIFLLRLSQGNLPDYSCTLQKHYRTASPSLRLGLSGFKLTILEVRKMIN